MFGEEAASDGEDVLSRGSGAEDDGEQFGGGEGAGAEALQALARSFILWQFGDSGVVGGFGGWSAVRAFQWLVVRHQTPCYDFWSPRTRPTLTTRMVRGQCRMDTVWPMESSVAVIGPTSKTCFWTSR